MNLKSIQTWASTGSMALKGIDFGYSPSYSTGSYLWPGNGTPDTRYDFGGVAGELHRNSAVMACIAWMQRTYPEAKVQVTKPTEDGDREPIPDHPMAQLVSNPNPFYSGDLLLQATVLDYVVSGNAYWLKARGSNGKGTVKELYHRSHRQMRPYRDQGSPNFIDGYLYSPTGGQPIRIPREDVIHFRFGLNPDNPMEGFSPLLTGTREVATDNEGNTYTATILRNMGIVSGVFSNKSPETFEFSEEKRRLLKDMYRAQVTGDARAEVLCIDGPIEYKSYGQSPEQMALSTIRNLPEDRICALLGLSAMVVGLTAGGLHRSYANYAEAREAAIEGNMLPTLKMFDQELDNQLLYTDFDPRRTLKTERDYSDIRALQPDEDAIHQRAREDYAAGLITRNQARAMIGQDEDADGDAYITDTAEPDPESRYNEDMDTRDPDERLTVVSTGKAIKSKPRHPVKERIGELYRARRLAFENGELTPPGDDEPFLEEDREPSANGSHE